MGSRSNAFTRQRRLLAKADFDRVFSQATIRLNCHPFLLLATRGCTTESRVGMVVGKRHARRAVDRNRIRRSIRESFRVLDLPCSVDVVILARPGAGACNGRQLADSLAELWSRLARKLEKLPEAGQDSPGR
ncbi:MAG: ribonuclease P protein component [Gammaproteobacteria bacterium]|nr:ribonuclease P protein component [Gammaproteobacteria bacterium]